jgi:DNA-binding response OmpR family regulator
MENKKVLIIDDEEGFGFLMTEFFSARGYHVFAAQSIARGMEILETENPECILLNNNLPDGHGWGETGFILMNYPYSQLILTSSQQVEKALSLPFHIVYKPLIANELHMILD